MDRWKELNKKFGILSMIILSSFLLASCSQKNNESDCSYSIEITTPSDANGPVTPGHSFFINGNIIGDEELPDGATFRVSVLSNEKEVRYAQAIQKNYDVIYRFHPSFFYYADDVDPKRESLTVTAMPFLIVEDINHPDDSFKDASIKCYFSNDMFTAFIPYATDQEHGLLFDDGVGYTDHDGNIYEALPEGNYIAKAVLQDKDGKILAEGSKEFRIQSAEESILCRFHPDEHYNNMMQFAKENNLSMNIDWLPGYYKDPNGNDHGGFREMFIGGDVAVYSTSRTHMFIYLADKNSSSLTIELPFLEKYRNIDDPEVFVAYCYDIGEPSINVGEDIVTGKIIAMEAEDKLRLCRGEYTDCAKEGYLDLADYKILESDMDFTDGLSLSKNTEGDLCISGVVIPHQLKEEEVLFDLKNNNTGLTNFVDTIVYEFTNGKQVLKYEKKVELTRYLNDEEHSCYPSVLEFYHVFNTNDFNRNENYHVSLYGVDLKGEIVQGTNEEFELSFR